MPISLSPGREDRAACYSTCLPRPNSYGSQGAAPHYQGARGPRRRTSASPALIGDMMESPPSLSFPARAQAPGVRRALPQLMRPNRNTPRAPSAVPPPPEPENHPPPTAPPLPEPALGPAPPTPAADQRRPPRRAPGHRQRAAAPRTGQVTNRNDAPCSPVRRSFRTYGECHSNLADSVRLRLRRAARSCS